MAYKVLSLKWRPQSFKDVVELAKKFVYISAYRGYFPDLKEHKQTWDNENGYYYMGDLIGEQEYEVMASADGFMSFMDSPHSWNKSNSGPTNKAPL